MPKITVDKNKCEGCQTCVAMFSELFEMDENNKSSVKDSDFFKYGYSKEEIESVCPTGAIKIGE